MSAKYKSPSFLLPNELNTSANTANDTGINSLYSMDFDGSNYVSITDDPLKDGATNFTLSAWVKANGTVGGSDISFLQNWVSPYVFIIRYKNNGNFQLYLNGGVKRIDVALSSLGLVNNNWNHIVLVNEYDNSQIKIYVNGTLQHTETSTQVAYPANTTPLKIGGDYNYWNGQIDEVAIFNRALTDGTGNTVNEIAALYDGTGSNIRPSNLMATNLNPIAYYPLGEQAQNSGYPGSLTPANNVWQFPNGVLQDYVMDFENSSNQYISGNASLPSSNYTISAWINLETVTTESIVSWGEDATGKRRSLFIWNGGSGAYKLYSSTYGSNIGGSTTLVAGQWYHAAVTVSSGGVAKIYLNGSQDGTGTNTLNAFTSTNFYIGRTPSGEYFDGKMSNVQIFNSALPETGSNSVETLYNNGSPLTSMSGFTSLINWWKLNADSVYTPSAPNYTTAVDFNYLNTDSLSLGTMSTLSAESEVTFSIWAKITKPGGSQGFNMLYTDNSDGGSGNKGLIYIEPSVSTARYKCTLRATSSLMTSYLPNATFNSWHNVTVTFGTTYAKLYLNGQLQDTETVGTAANLGVNAFIGRYSSSSSVYATGGLLSNFAIFNSELSASQISTLFNFGTPETNISFSPVHHWKLNDINTGLNDIGSLASNNAVRGAVTGSGPTTGSTSVAAVPSWKIPTALTIPSINYTTALDFDPSGSGDYISFGNQSAFEPASNYTFSIWFNGASSSYALFGTNSSAGTGVHALLTGTKILYYHGNQSVMEFNHGGLNIWHNFTVTWSSSTGILRSFIDGKYATQKVGVNSITWSNDLEVGRYNGGQFKYDGKLSNFAMWNTTLTDGFSGTPAQSQVAGGQVAEIYNNGQPQASITGSPVGWWKLDDQNTITDYSGNNYTGTNNGALDAPGDVTSPSFNIPVNGVSTTLPSTALQQSDLQFDSPYSNYSLNFDGTGDYITVTQDFSSYTSMSVSGWVRTASTSQYQYLFSTGVYNGGTPGNGQGFGIGFDNTGKFAAWAGGANYFTFGSVSANTWYHVIQTITGTTLRFYVNGVLTSTQTVGSFNIPSSAIAVIGAYSGNSIPTQSNLYGKADELSIFNYELTTSQVLEIYNNGRPKDLSTFSGTAPISWWRLGENAYFDNNSFTVPNSIAGAPNGIGSGTVTTMLSADAPGTYANGIGDGLAITDRVGDAPLSVANSQSYNMIPDNKVPYVPGYIGAQISNTSEMTFNGVDSFLNTTNIDLGINSTLSMWFKPGTNPTVNDYALIGEGSNGFDYLVRKQSGSAFYVWVGSGQVSSNAHNYGSVIANNINVGGWNFLAIQKAGDTITVYLKNTNGEFDATATKSAWATTSMTFDRIGARTISPVAQVFSGQIDEVAGFSETLTADQIKFDLYSATTTGKTADIENNTNLPTPVAWYRM